MVNLGYQYDDITTIVKNSIINDRLFHALLIYGEFGVGKTFLSSEIAKKILSSYSLNNNESFSSINFKNPDLFIIPNNIEQDSSTITVDCIRKIKKWFTFTTLKSKYKVLLIDDVDRMNNNANNAFLKILEEPIGNSIIILNTSKIELLSATLKSRCVKMKLRKKNLEKFTSILSNVFSLEDHAKFSNLYKLCNGDINLAITIIKSNQLNFLINSENEYNYNKILECLSELNIENRHNLRLFICLVEKIFFNAINCKNTNKNQLSKLDTLFSNISKIENILSNIQYLNKAYAKELVINILKVWVKD